MASFYSLMSYGMQIVATLLLGVLATMLKDFWSSKNDCVKYGGLVH